MSEQNGVIEVEYCGLKDRETDCVAGTGITWVGLGSRRMVPASAWEIMRRHPDVWKKVESKAAGDAAGDGTLGDSTPAPAPPPRPIGDILVARVDAMSREEKLDAYEKALGIKPPKRLKEGVLRDTLIEALRKAA